MNHDIRQPVMGSRLQILKEEIHRWEQRVNDYPSECKERLARDLIEACVRLQAFLWVLIGENEPEVRKLRAYQQAAEELNLIPMERSPDANS